MLYLCFLLVLPACKTLFFIFISDAVFTANECAASNARDHANMVELKQIKLLFG